ncbi:uncharacterized protein FOMMEDRAFT_163295 [Fomitiporia mediterranea MF3/22]|uniref:Uncharacterized protein n=1 Tax=Fomitiporia mediterranea (strain MF3/22) TaxID=694068 RepID=R7SFG5_FOMME|nr:uncharacterized protein FOMMEDRAFT_151080 [Fomitiporia mediterranea MF3/22]XP_007272289.1 uncharacterized protein FOMMEDRAFT_163295 [Fomitiporia mediterranea MF3/22]EJC97448.1 hypothetical protein FOMMEDRAFT_163295 [Fomitiporia mediterranea MF3/22]EJD08314.1 hypothetical protein FOMMEDRAFT_151080 [Fomitiporia mediterranea MF3/22]
MCKNRGYREKVIRGCGIRGNLSTAREEPVIYRTFYHSSTRKLEKPESKFCPASTTGYVSAGSVVPRVNQPIRRFHNPTAMAKASPQDTPVLERLLLIVKR